MESIPGHLKSLKKYRYELVSLPRNGSERHSESIFLFFVARTGIPTCFLFRGMVRNGIPKICIYLVPRYGIPSCVLFRRRVRNRIMGVYFYFCSSERNSEVVFSSAEGFGTEFRDFLFPGITGIPSEITICSVYSVFRGIIFLSEIPNPSPGKRVGTKRQAVRSVHHVQNHTCRVTPL